MQKRLREKGQASVEYLLVGLVLIAIMGALATLWRFAATGQLTALAEASASHALDSAGGIFDALLF